MLARLALLLPLSVTAQARQWVRMRDLGIPMTPIGLVRRISENYRASYGGEVEVGADTGAFRSQGRSRYGDPSDRFRATRDGTRIVTLSSG
ncbi:uncharacterized protein BDR25DRAFT_351231 [Lindgomyces ingoldianus]|uniref:Uncharacterized protein n=1 Tax=Lindgomyces ingoldianus TaxID=673940 RepID=A0ACB6R6A1_9PLEO|nr:uncharacterized protein BDR25DRAFT_351231 [Lindgomyces ingoldianus]KAF2474706.1 hypothetical protein BDR25DRAFT_351231 [Lindgomyces ingoldianus]